MIDAVKPWILIYSEPSVLNISSQYQSLVSTIKPCWRRNDIRKWLDIPISGTLSNVFLARNKFGLNICLPSIKFIQCQTVLRKALKSSRNSSIKDLWKSTSANSNIQYDVFKSTKDVLKNFKAAQEDKLLNHLPSQGFFFANIIKYSLTSLHSTWSIVHSNLPKNIFNFAIRYINNTLPTRKNLVKWGVLGTSDCSFCCSPESLCHVVAGCQSYLDRFTWRHDSILKFLASSLQPVLNSSSRLYADIDGFNSPSIITGDTHRPDLLVYTQDCLYILELTVGFESNLENNVNRKQNKYKNITETLRHHYKSVAFVNLSMSALGVFSNECSSFLDMLKCLKIDKKHQMYIVKKWLALLLDLRILFFAKETRFGIIPTWWNYKPVI